MKTIHASQCVTLPDGVSVTVRNRNVTVSGPRGKLQRAFRHQRVSTKYE